MLHSSLRQPFCFANSKRDSRGEQEHSSAENRILLEAEIGGDLVFVDCECQVAVFLLLPAYGQGTAGVQIPVSGIVGQKLEAVLSLDIAGGDFQEMCIRDRNFC